MNNLKFSLKSEDSRQCDKLKMPVVFDGKHSESIVAKWMEKSAGATSRHFAIIGELLGFKLPIYICGGHDNTFEVVSSVNQRKASVAIYYDGDCDQIVVKEKRDDETIMESVFEIFFHKGGSFEMIMLLSKICKPNRVVEQRFAPHFISSKVLFPDGTCIELEEFGSSRFDTEELEFDTGIVEYLLNVQQNLNIFDEFEKVAEYAGWNQEVINSATELAIRITNPMGELISEKIVKKGVTESIIATDSEGSFTITKKGESWSFQGKRISIAFTNKGKYSLKCQAESLEDCLFDKTFLEQVCNDAEKLKKKYF